MKFRPSKLGVALNELQRSERAAAARTSPGVLTRRGPDGTFSRPAWRPVGSIGFHPFEIYRYQVNTEGSSPPDYWRKFRVRSGFVGRINPEDVSGADGATDPDGVSAGPTIAEIVATSGEDEYWIWLEYDVDSVSPAATIKHSATPTSAGWPGFPNPCTTEGLVCIKLGWIDASDTTNKRAEIHQIVHDNLPDYYQACVKVSGVDKVINVPCDGQPFDFA